MKGLIVIGYQGIGKSSCAGKDNCIDLESGCFWIGDERHEDWFIPYCQIAMDLANQGYTVFTSSHKCVYEFFKSVPFLPNVGKAVIFCPKIRYKKEWIERLATRFTKTQYFKDFKALKNAEDRYEENIQELMRNGLPVYQPAAMDYDLMDYVRKARNDWCNEPPKEG